jgi:hypothetical protein
MTWASSVNAAETRRCIKTELVTTAPNVLHQRMTAHDHAGRVVAFESPHRSQPRFEQTVVPFDPIVRVLLHVVARAGHQLIYHRPERGSPIGHDLARFVVIIERGAEKPARGAGVALFET